MARTAGRALLLVSGLCACGGGSGRGEHDAAPDDSFDRRALVAHLAEDILYPTYQAFAARAGELDAAAGSWCGAVGDEGEADALAAARLAWKAAMVEWQKAEMMLVGPAAMNDRALRDVIYSWPVVSSCAVDQDVKLRWDDAEAYDIGSRTSNRRGLPALEYVLFTGSLDHTCPSQVAPQGWDAMSQADRLAARCGYAAVAATDLAARAREVERAWAPDGGDYVSELAAASSSSLSSQDAANLVSDALFYLDTDTKDMKLAEPAGITTNSCGAVEEACPDELESPVARHSKENVIANLVAFRMIYSGDREPGAGGLGFDDFLRGLGGGQLADEMAAETDAALAAAQAIDGTLEDAIGSDREAVVAVHVAVKAVTDDLKSQFLTVLGLDPPDGAAADND